MTKVINVFGGPGSGKSTFSARLFSEMKSKGVICELVTEAAKDLVWDNNLELLQDQVSLFAQQNRRVSRLIGKVDVVITDSPIIMGACYDQTGYKYLKPLMLEIWNSYNNINVFLKREKTYVSVGRTQTEVEAILKDKEILMLLVKNNIKFRRVLASDRFILDWFESKINDY